jgi:CBS domain containing-hemolysin-like protein
VHPVAFAIALLIVVYLHVTVGEMVPKNIALAVPDRAALVLTPPLVAVVTVLRPFLWVLNGVANLTLRAVRVEPRDEMASAFSRDEVAGMVEQSRAHGLLDRDEAALVHGALGFSDATLDAVAVDEVVAARPEATVAELEALARARGFSRLPLRDEHGWHGYVHVKDLLAPPAPPRDAPAPAGLVRPLTTLAAVTPLADALTGMRRSGAHLALVAEEGREADRVVALDDVLAALVGDIQHGGARSRTRS